MGLLNILGLKKEKEIKKEEKPKFIDENLSVEEIDKKIGIMSCNDAKKYFSQLSPLKKLATFLYSTDKFSKYREEEDKKCLKEHGRTAYDYYDLEHPSYSCI